MGTNDYRQSRLQKKDSFYILHLINQEPVSDLTLTPLLILQMSACRLRQSPSPSSPSLFWSKPSESPHPQIATAAIGHLKFNIVWLFSLSSEQLPQNYSHQHSVQLLNRPRKQRLDLAGCRHCHFLFSFGSMVIYAVCVQMH